jgi:ubiquinone/menaquinone biosynthesis C-methylase UbiE
MDYTVNNQQSYNEIASEFSGTRAYVWEDIDFLMNYVKDSDSIIDIGCGNGRLLKNSKIQNPNYLGIDFSEGLIAQAKKDFPDYKFEVLDVQNLKALNKQFDIGFAVSVLNHLPKERQQRALENIKAVIKPGGYLLMINWNLWDLKSKKSVWKTKNKGKTFKDLITTWKGGDKQAELYYYAFTKREIKKLLKKNGFKIIKNFYSKKGKRSSMLRAENIVTVAQLED